MIDLVAILTLTVPFIFVIVFIWLINNEKKKRYQLKADVYSKAIENGQPVPSDLFDGFEKKNNPLNTGIILMSAGAGISLFFVLMSISFARTDAGTSSGLMSVASVGVIPFLVGVGFLIIHFIEKKKAANGNAQ